MHKKYCYKFILFAILYLSGFNICFAETSSLDYSPIKTINIKNANYINKDSSKDLTQVRDAFRTIYLSKNDPLYNFTNATDKFVQCNIKASWADFKLLINTVPKNDFTYISLANKMANLGFFDLAALASSKIQDKQIGNLSMDAMNRFYFPRKKLKLDDELFLAEIYSNISFNNQSSEATNELLNKTDLLNNYDYANYLVAFGSYKSNLFVRAAKYINIAILQNPSNLNYQKLKAEILAEKNMPDDALKIVDNLKKQNLYSYEYEKKVASLEQFILYKTQKKQWLKDYHLGYYYYLEDDPSKAIRCLQKALNTKRAKKGLVYSLMSEVYFSMNEFEKALDTAQKAYKIKNSYPKSLITLGNLSYMDQDYKHALKYYRKAASKDKDSYIPLVKEAQTYQKLANIKKAEDIYTKVLKTHSDSWEAYFNVALLNNDQIKTIYLKKSLAINPLFKDAWIELAKLELDKGNYKIAELHLENALAIDENDFRYYYYQGLINNCLGNYDQAKYNFKKCLKLNSDYEKAQSELDKILNKENIPKTIQDNI